MSVTVRKRMDRDGAWLADIRGMLPDGTRYRERIKPPVTSHSAAVRWAQQREACIIAAGGNKKRKEPAPTLASFVKRFKEGHLEAQGLKPSSKATMESIIEKHLVPTFGTTRLDEIGGEAVQRFKGAMLSKGRSPKTINNVVTVLSVMLKRAVDWDVIDEMPCRMGLLRVPPPPYSFYEFGDYARLLDAAKVIGTNVEVMVLLGGDAGLRRGEIIGLEWADIDTRRASLNIQRSVWDGHATAPKGGRSRRVPMTERLSAALKAHRHLRGPRVLCHEDGSPIAKKALERWMSKATKQAGLPVSRELHALRHTFCSHLAMQGAPAKAIQELAGHTSLSTTLRYMHLSPAAKDAAVRLLDHRPTGEEEAGHQGGTKHLEATEPLGQ